MIIFYMTKMMISKMVNITIVRIKDMMMEILIKIKIMIMRIKEMIKEIIKMDMMMGNDYENGDYDLVCL